MRQEHILTSKKRIILLSLMGVIPFYFELITYLFFFEIYNNNFFKIRGATSFYGALIISFLCGMQWERLISQKKVKFYLLPMIPVIFLWISFLLSTKFNFNVLIILGLLWCLIIEIFFIKTINLWFLKIRLIATILSLIPLFSIFFVV